jgi:NAD-dependent dihydropyrimidine dehydrogenase PreA subunit
MTVVIDLELCTGCGVCVKKCPYGAVDLTDKKALINERCTSCGACIESCPVEAIASDLPPRAEVDPASYRDVWVFAEQRRGVLNRTVFELLGCARRLADELGQSTAAVLLGRDVEPLADTLFHYGANKVFVAENEALWLYGTQPYTRVIADLVKEYQPGIFLFGATHAGRDLAPRLSRRLDLGLTADCTKLSINDDGHLLQTRPAFGGNVMATIISPYARPQMATVRPGIMEALDRDSNRSGELVRVPANLEQSDLAVQTGGGDPGRSASCGFPVGQGYCGRRARRWRSGWIQTAGRIGRRSGR